LHFEEKYGDENVWSVRITYSYRALGERHNDEIVWFFIGSHADYEKYLP
jgi:hypothetical protein